jgi:hypothetical protein
MKISIIGQAKDQRTNTNVLYAQMPIKDYLELVGNEFDEFEIQRGREKHKAYNRMKRDIIDGALLPAITLAVKPQKVKEILSFLRQKEPDYKSIENYLSQPGQVNILDGLQRTYILKDIEAEITNFAPGQKILVEFWLESEIRNLIYRIIVLNAGQKPMSMRHQIDLLFISLEETLEQDIKGLTIYRNKKKRQRSRSREYALDIIATAYQSFITQDSEVEKQNIVAQKIAEEEFINSSAQELSEQFYEFERYLNIYTDLDDEICRIYRTDYGKEIPNGVKWFGSENVMNSFFAAVSSKKLVSRVNQALDVLLGNLRNSCEGDDPIALQTLQEIQKGFNPRKVNIGFATRKLLTKGFKEYFHNEGKTNFQTCWRIASE